MFCLIDAKKNISYKVCEVKTSLQEKARLELLGVFKGQFLQIFGHTLFKKVLLIKTEGSTFCIDKKTASGVFVYE